MGIDKTAIIDSKAEIAKDVEIGPYSIVEADVKIGPGTKIGERCSIRKHTTIGKNCHIFSGAIIGSITQDKKFKGKKSFLKIGDNNIIREYVTINRGTDEGTMTKIGNNNLFMAYSHIAHDCAVGNNVVIANCGTLAGHVMLEDSVIVGGLAAIHQFVRIGELAIIGGCSKVVQDIPPYSMVDGHPAKVYGVNSVGLDRAGLDDNVKKDLKKAFKIIFLMKLNIKNAIRRVEEELPKSRQLNHLIEFIKSSERGLSR